MFLELLRGGQRRSYIFHNRVGVWYFQVDSKTILKFTWKKALISIEMKKIFTPGTEKNADLIPCYNSPKTA